MLACGEAGKKRLENLLANEAEDILVRQRAFRVLRVPQTFNRYRRVAEEENDRIWQAWPTR